MTIASGRTVRTIAAIFAAALCFAVPAAARDAGVHDKAVSGPAPAFRPPAVPLMTHDPYFSVWSFRDNLADDWPRHWTGTAYELSALARVDGSPYRIMGPNPRDVPAFRQTSVEVKPTQTLYTLAAAGIELTLTFTSPLLIQDLDIMSRPVTYVTVAFHSTDGRSHPVSFYFGAPAGLCVNAPDEAVVWGRLGVPGLEVMAIGSKDQPILEKKGDNLRIDWGWLYLAAPEKCVSWTAMAPADACRELFARSGRLPEADETGMPQPAGDGLGASVVFDFGAVGEAPVSRHLMVAYDDVFSIEYFDRRLRPYWRRAGWEAGDLLAAAEEDYPALLERCRSFDAALTADMEKAGGEKYARIAALAYRQSLAACKLAVDFDGTPLFFPKENFSNGCVSTVDVIYPAAPEYLLLSPALVRALLTPVLEYARSPHWPFPFAPHDLGTYPRADGQVYGGGNRTEEDQMPVEESGNMIILAAALAQAEGRPDFAVRYWDLLARWAGYLKEKGFDPENQLCTDDFAGHLAHNANLSLKAILALRAYAWLCDQTGRKAEGRDNRLLAGGFVRSWMAKADGGDHYRLAFDRSGTWSQKYNLVWDKILGFGLFPASVARKELDYYLGRQLRYGLPLDSRRTYTKLDWVFWTATLANDAETFERLTAPVFDFLNETPDRVPLTDWYWTDTGRKTGFQARPVVGGVLIKMLADPALRAKWRKNQ
jgi:hypothetical protein